MVLLSPYFVLLIPLFTSSTSQLILCTCVFWTRNDMINKSRQYHDVMLHIKLIVWLGVLSRHNKLESLRSSTKQRLCYHYDRTFINMISVLFRMREMKLEQVFIEVKLGLTSPLLISSEERSLLLRGAWNKMKHDSYFECPYRSRCANFIWSVLIPTLPIHALY